MGLDPVFNVQHEREREREREEHRLRLFENRVLRRIFGSNRGEVKGGWRKLHNKELHKFSYN
jgi:hypothetical protein